MSQSEKNKAYELACDEQELALALGMIDEDEYIDNIYQLQLKYNQ